MFREPAKTRLHVGAPPRAHRRLPPCTPQPVCAPPRARAPPPAGAGHPFSLHRVVRLSSSDAGALTSAACISAPVLTTDLALFPFFFSFLSSYFSCRPKCGFFFSLWHGGSPLCSGHFCFSALYVLPTISPSLLPLAPPSAPLLPPHFLYRSIRRLIHPFALSIWDLRTRRKGVPPPAPSGSRVPDDFDLCDGKSAKLQAQHSWGEVARDRKGRGAKQQKRRGEGGGTPTGAVCSGWCELEREDMKRGGGGGRGGSQGCRRNGKQRPRGVRAAEDEGQEARSGKRLRYVSVRETKVDAQGLERRRRAARPGGGQQRPASKVG